MTAILVASIGAVAIASAAVLTSFSSLHNSDTGGQQASVGSLLVNDPTRNPGASHADRIWEECQRDAYCAGELLIEISETEDKQTVLATFDELMFLYEEQTDYCHGQAHHMAMFLYNYLGNVTEALSHASGLCGGALYHGLLSTDLNWHALSHNHGEHLDVASICPVNPDNPYDDNRYECLHGVGHGLTIFHGYNISLAANHCTQFDSEWDRNSCLRGAFMENVVYHYRTANGDFDDNDIFYPCSALDEEYGPACYNWQSRYILVKRQMSYEKAFSECDKISPEEFIEYCYRGLGVNLYSKANRNMDNGIRLCQTGNPEYQTHCLRGLVAVMADHGGLDQASGVCKASPEHLKADCYDRLGMIILQQHPSYQEREQACSIAENEEYYDICMGASLEDVKLL